MREITQATSPKNAIFGPKYATKADFALGWFNKKQCPKGENNAGRWFIFLLLLSPVLLIVQHCLELKELIKGR